MKLVFTALIIVVLSALISVLAGFSAPVAMRRDFDIKARRYAFDPHRIIVNKGDEVHIRLASMDVVHGFYMEGYDVDALIEPEQPGFKLRRPSKKKEYSPAEEIVFTAAHSGKFRYRCSQTCGSLHPFMQGEMIVRSNTPFLASVGGAVGIFIAAFVVLFMTAAKSKVEELSGKTGISQVTEPTVSRWRLDLLRVVPGLKWLLSRRWFQFAVILPNMVIFYFFLIAGIFGSPVGNRNIIVIFVWIFWWFLLITFMVPFASRIWCVVCPFPFFGEWFQRMALIKVRVGKMFGLRNKMFGLNKRWPRKLSNIWLQNILFLGLCTFSAMLLTRPIVSVIVLGGLFVIATILSLVYRQRAFCMYVCPVSGFQGLYAMTSMLELRAIDKGVCRKKCKTANCLTGSEQGWACPWFQYVGKMERNNYCGLCMECLKSCPNDNITVYARPFCADTVIKGFDEAWKAFIMLALAMVYSVTLLGPWGTIKDWANIAETGNWKGFSIYAGIIWFTALIGFPVIWYAACKLGKVLARSDGVSTKDIFIRYSYMLVPLGLLAWIAFSFPLIMINGSYIISIISDPFGWGWNLAGTAHIPWSPIFPQYLAYIQIPLLLLGLYFAMKRGYGIARTLYTDSRAAARSLIMVSALCTAVTIFFLRLFIG